MADAAAEGTSGKVVIRNIGLLLSGDIDRPILDADTLVIQDGLIKAVGREKDCDLSHPRTTIDIVAADGVYLAAFAEAVEEEYRGGVAHAAFNQGRAQGGGGVWMPVGRPEYLRQCVMMSLRRLKLDRLPLWQRGELAPLRVPRSAADLSDSLTTSRLTLRAGP